MIFVAGGNECSAGEGQQRILAKAGVRQRHPPGAQPRQANESVTDKMAHFADVVMNALPAGVAHVPEDRFEDRAERAGRVVRPEKFSGFGNDNANSNCYRQPRANPEFRAARAIRHGSWALRA